ncbi:Glycosyltransferase involved in cell wall bisynthesis [Maribacter orientalis]|uniref:Glycosyltransferase involved in cell wall bisynthesis n=1 Tax=Maribacter orientalis TaxID=228957 RepID=A0A1H7NAG2_9FLAO|nr:glycosyltransferase [Maribacter orientalis]SEL19907.1 Glycosyltransferase involved in cell wall bisynthesis [Maribacter orientalis]
MNILFLIGKYPNHGGTEVVTTVLANAFAKKGYAVSIASFEQTVPELSTALDKTIKLFALSYPVYSRRNIRDLKKIIFKEDIDFVLNQWCLPLHVTKMCNAAIGKTKCKVISVLHGIPDKNKRLVHLENKIKATDNSIVLMFYKLAHEVLLNVTAYNLKYVYRYSAKYVVLSESYMESFIKLSKIKNASRLLTIGNPLTISNEDYQYDPTSKEKVILYVGRMDHTNKRVDRIIEAWEKLFEVYPDWKLVLIGDGPDRATLEKYVKRKKILGVQFKGFKNDAPTAHYAKSSILILTSDLEGFGLVLIEAMSYAVVPVVYGSYTAVYDIVTDNTSGFITNMPYSEEETVLKLKELMSNPNKRNLMAEQALDKSKNFKLEMILNQWEILFAELNTK